MPPIRPFLTMHLCAAVIIGAISLGALSLGSPNFAAAQLVVTYAANVDEVLSAQGPAAAPDLLRLGYEMQLPLGLSLTPSLGVLVDQQAADTLISPGGYALGVWGAYDFASFGDTTTYALGGLSFVDFGDDEAAGISNWSQLQYGVGLGALIPLSDNVGAFTNVTYTLIDGSQSAASYDGATTGLEIGIEIAF